MLIVLSAILEVILIVLSAILEVILIVLSVIGSSIVIPVVLDDGNVDEVTVDDIVGIMEHVETCAEMQ